MSEPAHTITEHATSTASRAAADRVQKKLSVGRSNDAYEQEADRVANAVVNPSVTPAARAGRAPVPAAEAARGISKLQEQPAQRMVQRQEEEKEPQGKLQRQEEEKEPQGKLQRQEEEKEPQGKLQRQEEEKEPQGKLQRQEEEKEKDVQAKRKDKEKEKEKRLRQKKKQARTRGKAPRQVEDKLAKNKGKGEPLPRKTRASMEAGFGADFSGVKVHTGADAEAMNRDLRAQAFTHGKDVFFNAGKFEPDSGRGKKLLAHELTHVVQQGAARQKAPEEKTAKKAGDKSPPPKPAGKEAAAPEKEPPKSWLAKMRKAKRKRFVKEMNEKERKEKGE